MLCGLAAQTSPAESGQYLSTEADKAYVASVIKKIRSNVTYRAPAQSAENPRVVFRVIQLPSGEVVSVTQVLSSGIPAFDDAVERGIRRASPLPKRRDGSVEHELVIEYLFTN